MSKKKPAKDVIEYTGDWVVQNYPPSPMTYAYAIPLVCERPGINFGRPVYLHEMTGEEAFAFIMASHAVNRLKRLLAKRGLGTNAPMSRAIKSKKP